ncbi:uncharacterized protein HMPREF1541_04713 [Cyphellophora europaea CBS 101466]|uniref:NAD(P)-binding protein n=1 Tax=Cyphellophora europaea (strain CBS 101466) TaxID=1220924 RepID=W2RVB0_CYPE1|nr:uncharacterized protein HMPREF1541_04713 [Cyphellophora europaea CBS 101466]ETN40436.1 hypothetical protein HMPREF1541_04713 [Cyphellophora europaea CBS 101466]
MPSAIFGHSTTGVEVVKQYPAQIKNKTFVITGTSEGGTGAEAAIALSHGSPAHIFLLARSETKVTPVIDQIHSTSPQTQTHYFPIVSTVILYVQRFSTCRSKSRTNTILHASRVGDCVPSVLTPETLESLAIEGRGASLPCLASAIVTPIQLDNFDSVRYAAAEVNKLVPRVDVIINSAGMMHENFSLNPDGIETTFAANYLGHFLLTSCLMHRVAGVRSDTRVVNVASNGHGICDFRGIDYNF